MALRFRLSDLNPRQQAQIMTQLAPSAEGSPSVRCSGGVSKPTPNAPAAKPKAKRVRPSITMVKPREMSQAESLFNRDILRGHGKYEAITLHLPGGSKYTPDFLDYDAANGITTLWEVKGSYRLQSHGRAATAFKTACAIFPCFVFAWAEQTKQGGWKVSRFVNGGLMMPAEIISATKPPPVQNIPEGSRHDL